MSDDGDGWCKNSGMGDFGGIVRRRIGWGWLGKVEFEQGCYCQRWFVLLVVTA